MIKYFSSGYLIRYVVVLFLGTILWLPSLLYPEAYTGIPGFTESVISNLCLQNTRVQTIIAFIITLFSALYLNRVAVENGLTGKLSTLVLFIYILVTSSLLPELHNNPIIWVNLIVVFVIGDTMKLPHVKYVIPVVFNASFLIGIAAMFYSPVVFLIVFIWISIIIHRVVTLRSLVVSILGVFLPYLFLFSWSFFNDSFSVDFHNLLFSMQVEFSAHIISDPVDIIVSVVLLILTIISMMGIIGKLNEKNINLRRNLTIALSLVIISGSIFLIFSKSTVTTLLLAIPITLIIGHWFSNINRTRWFDITLWLLLIFTVINQYSYLIYRL